MITTTHRVARHCDFRNTPAAPPPPPSNIRSDEIPDILSGWRAGLIGEPVDRDAGLAWLWAYQCASVEGGTR